MVQGSFVGDNRPQMTFSPHSIAKNKVQSKSKYSQKKVEKGTCGGIRHMILSTWLDIVCLNKLFPRHIIHGYLNPVARNL